MPNCHGHSLLSALRRNMTRSDIPQSTPAHKAQVLTDAAPIRPEEPSTKPSLDGGTQMRRRQQLTGMYG
ncbi:hypothetical protein BT67DRAFT_50141 [Trichocladium antarcticum]|uniref:Uncharacterized protein n=1 Tax=Trichocladium antarcticum TaxID=1450529 RepID=A0AAN6UIB3_9PEZI|nr:hypothetical protein BT67DRAFT_50141 [Trichocladium antarcticum]